jgi:hypothetical protein
VTALDFRPYFACSVGATPRVPHQTVGEPLPEAARHLKAL